MTQHLTNEDLILKLRGQAYTTCRPDQLCDQAADLLQSQAERIKELEGDVEYLQKDIDAMCNAIPGYHWSGGAAELIAKCFADRDTLRAELAEIEKAEPVAWRWVWKSKLWDFEGWCYTNTPPNHPELQEIEKLFTHPMPAQDVTELVEALEKLARLGNGEHYGNSDGNMIARDALSKYKGAK